MKDEIAELIKLYNQVSKHSNYQILPESLLKIVGNSDISVKSRYEEERLAYILRHIGPTEKAILDIGGNSGYFSFELASKLGASVDYYDGNKIHAQFVKLATSLLPHPTRITVHDDYFPFERRTSKKYDVILLLNVLHHLGDDFGDHDLSVTLAKKKMIDYLNGLSVNTEKIFLQIGFCWKGDRNLPLFEKGTKEELVDFIRRGTETAWDIADIAVAERREAGIRYAPLNETNIIRRDDLGEFLNRPIFTLTSKRR